MASQRQLCELLEEKQEPFLLDVYLLENGCSSKRLKKLSSLRFRRTGFAVGFLRSMLTKLVQGKPFSKALNWDRKTIESGRLSSVFSCFSSFRSTELSGDHQWRCIEMEDSKQLSPVSVLGFPNHRFKEENQSSTSSSDSPREMHEIFGFSHYTKSNKGQNQEQLLLDCVREAGEIFCDYHHEIRAKFINGKVLLWQSMQGDVSSLTKLSSSDISELRNEWSHLKPEMRQIEVGIEAAIFEEIVDETVLEILGTRCT